METSTISQKHQKHKDGTKNNCGLARTSSAHFLCWPKLLFVFSKQLQSDRPVRNVFLHTDPKMSMDKPRQRICRKSLGKRTPSNESSCWRERSPKVNFCRLLGKVTPSKLWLNKFSKFNVCRLFGSATPAKLWLKTFPKVSVCKLLGNITPDKLWLKRRSKGQCLQAARQCHTPPNSDRREFQRSMSAGCSAVSHPPNSD